MGVYKVKKWTVKCFCSLQELARCAILQNKEKFYHEKRYLGMGTGVSAKVFWQFGHDLYFILLYL